MPGQKAKARAELMSLPSATAREEAAAARAPWKDEKPHVQHPDAPMGTAVAIPAASLFLPASSARLNHLQHSSIKPLKAISAPLWKARTTAMGSTVPEGGCRPQHAAARLHGGSAFWGEGTGPNSPMWSACGGGTASPSVEASRKLSRSPARSLPCFVPVSFLHFNHEPFCPGFLTHGLGGNRGTAALTLRLA